MFCRFRTPLKEAPVWNVLITSICKESESETALLHREKEEEGGVRRAGERGWRARVITLKLRATGEEEVGEGINCKPHFV